MTKEELEKALEILSTAKPCPKHGLDCIAICAKCLQGMWCSECFDIPCQCDNDD